MKIVFGCAQFSNNYISGQRNFDLSKIKNLLKIIKKNKVRYIDYAPSYEGNIPFSKIDFSKFKIYSKLRKIPKSITKKNLRSFIFKEIENDLKVLKVKKLEGYYVHETNDILKFKNLLFKIMLELKKRKFIKKICVSHYDIFYEKKIYKYFKPDLIQVPLNIFDYNQKKIKLLKKIKKKKIEIFIRSIFLKGIVLTNSKSIDRKLHWIRENMSILEKKYQIDSYSKKIKYSLDVLFKNKFFEGVIFSPASEYELIEFLDHFHSKKKFKFINIKKKIPTKELDPRKWN